MKNKIFITLGAGIVCIALASCNSGTSINTYQQLQVTSTDTNPMIYQASLNSTATHTYQVIINSNASPASVFYVVNVALPGAQFNIESNGCTKVYANQTCNIQIGFTPTSQNNYAANNLISFSVGALESSINVATIP